MPLLCAKLIPRSERHVNLRKCGGYEKTQPGIERQIEEISHVLEKIHSPFQVKRVLTSFTLNLIQKDRTNQDHGDRGN